jgi:hypothetical protein
MQYQAVQKCREGGRQNRAGQERQCGPLSRNPRFTARNLPGHDQRARVREQIHRFDENRASPAKKKHERREKDELTPHEPAPPEHERKREQNGRPVCDRRRQKGSPKRSIDNAEDPSADDHHAQDSQVYRLHNTIDVPRYAGQDGILHGTWPSRCDGVVFIDVCGILYHQCLDPRLKRALLRFKPYTSRISHRVTLFIGLRGSLARNEGLRSTRTTLGGNGFRKRASRIGGKERATAPQTMTICSSCHPRRLGNFRR